MTDVDDGWESPEEYEAAQRRAEEPPEWYLEEEGRRRAERHRVEDHGGAECDCPPWWPPPCRVLFRLPRWWPGKGWRCGTPGGCESYDPRSPLAARRVHRCHHEAPF